MSDLKNGDMVELTAGLTNSFHSGDKLKFVCSDGDNAMLSYMIVVSKDKFKKVEGSKPDYEKSNRKKLHDHIKASGYTSSELGENMGNKWYFSNITKKSRFDKFGDISNDDLLKNMDLTYSTIDKIIGYDKLDNVETETDSEFQFVGGGYDTAFDMPESKNTTSEVHHHTTNNYALKYSNFIKLQKLAFAICLIMVILLISILYFIVSK